jgi:hypothetical protein
LTTVDDRIQHGPAHASTRGHEPNTIMIRGLAIAAAALIGTGIVVEVILALVMQQFATKERRLDSLYPHRTAIDVDQFPNPRLQENPSVELARMKAEERRRFDAYGWVDPKGGIAHIPVERAMDILARTGLPKVPAPAPTIGAPPQTSIPPGTKREEAKQATDSPAPTQTQRSRPPSKEGQHR